MCLPFVQFDKLTELNRIRNGVIQGGNLYCDAKTPIYLCLSPQGACRDQTCQET